MDLSSYLRKSLHIVIGVGLGQIIVLAFMPIITRLYRPEEFSAYSEFLYFSSLFSTVLIFRFDSVLVPVKSESKRNFLFGYFISLYAAVSVALLLGWSLIFSISLFEGNWQEKVHLPFLYALGAVTTALFQFVIGGLVARGAYGRINNLRIGQSLVLGIGQAVFALIDLAQKAGLMLGEIGSRFWTLIYYARFLKFRPKFLVLKFNLFCRIIKPLLRQGLFSTLSTLLSTASLLSPVIFTKFATDGVQAAGFFILAYKVVTIPVSLISRSMAQVFLGEGKSMSDSEIARAIKKGVLINFLLAIALGACIAIFSFCSSIFFGGEWEEASIYIRNLIPLVMGQILLLPLVQVFTIKNRNGKLLAWEFFRFASIHSVVGVFIYVGIDGALMISVYSFAMLASYLLLLMVIYRDWVWKR